MVQTDSAAVGVFADQGRAEHAVQALARAGFGRGTVDFVYADRTSAEGGLLGPAIASGQSLATALVQLGVAEAPARFYADEFEQGRSLVVVRAGAEGRRVREILENEGAYDVQKRGGALARGPSEAGGAGAVMPAPQSSELTERFQDVASRYEMLFGQRFGATDRTWEQLRPVYARGWQMAMDPRFTGRRWDDVAPTIRAEWQRDDSGVDWVLAVDALRDVWEDVADEAATGREGGEQRRVVKPIDQL